MFLPTATDIMNPACLSSVVRSTLPTFNSAFQLFRTNTKTRLLEVGRYVGKTSIVLPISIYQYRYRVGTLDIGFQYNWYRIGDKWYIGKFLIYFIILFPTFNVSLRTDNYMNKTEYLIWQCDTSLNRGQSARSDPTGSWVELSPTIRVIRAPDVLWLLLRLRTRGQSNLTKSALRGAHSPVRGHPRGSKVVPLNSWGRVSY